MASGFLLSGCTARQARHFAHSPPEAVKLGGPSREAVLAASSGRLRQVDAGERGCLAEICMSHNVPCRSSVRALCRRPLRPFNCDGGPPPYEAVGCAPAPRRVLRHVLRFSHALSSPACRLADPWPSWSAPWPSAAWPSRCCSAAVPSSRQRRATRGRVAQPSRCCSAAQLPQAQKAEYATDAATCTASSSGTAAAGEPASKAGVARQPRVFPPMLGAVLIVCTSPPPIPQPWMPFTHGS